MDRVVNGIPVVELSDLQFNVLKAALRSLGENPRKVERVAEIADVGLGATKRCLEELAAMDPPLVEPDDHSNPGCLVTVAGADALDLYEQSHV